MFEPLQEEPDDLFDVDSLRRQWDATDLPLEPKPSPPHEVPLSPRQQLSQAFQALRVTLASSFPERRDTTDLLLDDLENALADHIETGTHDQEQDDLMSLTEKIDRLEDYLEAIFVESGFWRLKR